MNPFKSFFTSAVYVFSKLSTYVQVFAHRSALGVIFVNIHAKFQRASELGGRNDLYVNVLQRLAVLEGDPRGRHLHVVPAGSRGPIESRELGPRASLRRPEAAHADRQDSVLGGCLSGGDGLSVDLLLVREKRRRFPLDDGQLLGRRTAVAARCIVAGFLLDEGRQRVVSGGIGFREIKFRLHRLTSYKMTLRAKNDLAALCNLMAARRVGSSAVARGSGGRSGSRSSSKSTAAVLSSKLRSPRADDTSSRETEDLAFDFGGRRVRAISDC